MPAIRVLIIEGSPLVREGIACLLRQSPDFDCVGTARRGSEAPPLVEELAPNIVLVNEQLPDAPATDVVRRLREIHHNLRVVVLVKHAEEKHFFDLIASGASGFVTKQDETQTLFEALRAVARDDEVWLSPHAAADLMPRRGRGTETTSLTEREREVLLRVAVGEGNERIAEALHLAPGTVRNVLSGLYGKLDVHSRSEAVAWAWRNGLVRPEKGRQ